MGYSNDLPVRVIHVVESGVAARAAARQFVIGDATAIRWVKRWRETGSVEAKSIKGQSRSPLKRHEEWLLDLVRQEPDLTLEEIQRRLLDERAVHLRDGAHGERVLQRASRGGAVGATRAEERAEAGGGADLTGVGARRDDLLLEALDAAVEGVEGVGDDEVG